MGSIILVTGTDTGVGKTVVSAWLAYAAPDSWRVAVVKAVQTGADPRVDGDEAFYRSALEGRRRVATATLAALPEPLAPSIAARRAGVTLRVADLAQRCFGIAAAHDLTIVEGAGGLLAPINDGADFADLARELQAELVVVARPGLGTLNHTALTLEAAAARRLVVRLLVCSGVTARMPAVQAENLRFFRQRYPEIPLVTLRKAARGGLADLEALRPRLVGRAPAFLEGANLTLAR